MSPLATIPSTIRCIFYRGRPDCLLARTACLSGNYCPSRRGELSSHGCENRMMRRYYASSSPLLDGSAVSRHAKPSEEMQDVTAMDEFMNVVRRACDPRQRSVMPVRTPLLWSETMSARSTAPITSPTVPTAGETIPLPSTRSMHDSYSELVLPFGSQPDLLEQYTNASGGLRIGKLMEHLDSLAGSIAYKHVLGPGISMFGNVRDRGFFIVTAAVDRLDMLRPLTAGNIRDLRLCGHVIYTGQSSMEVVVKMELMGDKDETAMLGRFSMVCRDAHTQTARPVPRLSPSTPEEQALFAMGAAHKERKKALALRSLDRVPPSTEEAAELHALFLRHGQSQTPSPHAEERTWMEETALENCFLMFPQERNVHSKIFGGYLMRLAYELSFTTAALFSRRPLRFLSLDGLSFSHPVPIGSILRLRSQVACTASNATYPAIAHATVKADVVDVGSGEELTTNKFRFTWCDERGPPLGRRVVPRTYQEAMEWIEAKRALGTGDEIRRLRDQRAQHE